MTRNHGGFTLIETLIVVAIIGLLIAVATPAVSQYLDNAKLRDVNQTIAGSLLGARQRAISLNREVWVKVVLDAGADNANNTIVLESPSGTAITAVREFPDGVEIRANEDCSAATGTISLKFNPDGSSSARYLCVMDGSRNKYRTGVGNAATGRVVSQLWNPATGKFK